MAHKVTLIPGDGTGPEIAEATKRVLEATGVEFEWDQQEAGEDVYESEGNPLPDATIESVRKNGLALKGPTTTPVGSGFRSINVALRKEFDLYSCIRPCKAYEGVRTRFPETDIVIVRENTEDLYAGIEFENGSDENEKLQKFLKDELDSPVREDSGISIKPISVFGSERIVESAFDYAEQNGRKKVTAAHKANIMKHSDGLFLDTARRVAEKHPDIEFEDRIIDNLCNQLVSRPEEYDVIVLPNLYGDIVSDLGAGPQRRSRPGAGGKHRLRGSHLRGHPRLSAQVQGQERDQPDGADAVRDAHAPPPGRGRRRRPARVGHRRRDQGGRQRHLRPQAHPRRPVRRRHLRVRRRGHRGDEQVSEPVNVTVTGAAGAIGYALLFRAASGDLLGPDTPVKLTLLEIPDAVKAAEGTAMELDDCAFPLLREVEVTDDQKEAFSGCNVALLVGAKPRGEGMDRSDLLEANGGIFKPQGEAINAGAAEDIKVLVVGNPANTNCLIAQQNAPDIPAERFTAMTRLDQNRAMTQLARKANDLVANVHDLAVWGNHSNTMYPDVFSAKVDDVPAWDAIDQDQDWLENDFIPTVAGRGGAIIKARGASSAASAANAAIDHVHDWVLGTGDEWVSMAVPSDGSYGVPEGLISSFPVTTNNGEWEIVQGIELSDFSKERIKATTDELAQERETVKDLLG